MNLLVEDQQDNQKYYEDQGNYEEDNNISEQNMIKCDKCNILPVNYIELNCQHSFCLDCMACWFIYKQYFQNNVMQENDNNNENTLNIECIYCQKITELDSDSLFAIKDRMEQIQMQEQEEENEDAEEQEEEEEENTQINQSAYNNQG